MVFAKNAKGKSKRDDSRLFRDLNIVSAINKKNILWLVILVLVDEIVKFSAIKFAKSIAVINSDGAFSIKFGSVSFLILSVIALVLLVVLVAYIKKSYLTHFGFTMMVAGGFANILDRLFYGGVVDFLHSNFWPTFNLADAYITAGAIWLVIDLMRRPRID